MRVRLTPVAKLRANTIRASEASTHKIDRRLQRVLDDVGTMSDSSTDAIGPPDRHQVGLNSDVGESRSLALLDRVSPILRRTAATAARSPCTEPVPSTNRRRDQWRDHLPVRWKDHHLDLLRVPHLDLLRVPHQALLKGRRRAP